MSVEVCAIKVSAVRKFYFTIKNFRINPQKIHLKATATEVIQKNILAAKRIHCIPPLIYKSKFVIDFYLKSDIFNSLFAKQCSPIENNSRKQLEFLQVDPSETLGHNIMQTICKPLHMICMPCLENGFFPSIWKMVYLIPIHKKESK